MLLFTEFFTAFKSPLLLPLAIISVNQENYEMLPIVFLSFAESPIVFFIGPVCFTIPEDKPNHNPQNSCVG